MSETDTRRSEMTGIFGFTEPKPHVACFFRGFKVSREVQAGETEKDAADALVRDLGEMVRSLAGMPTSGG